MGEAAMKIRLVFALMLFGTAVLAQTSPQPTPQDFLQSEPETQLQDRLQRRPAAEIPSATGATEPLSNMATGVSVDRYIGDAAKAPSRQWHNVMFTQNLLRA